MTLRFKMILGIGAILLVVILAYGLIALRAQGNYLQGLARHEADLIAAVADRALARAMGQGETEIVQAILARIGEHAVLAGIRIVDPSGTIRRSNRPEEIGRLLPPGERPHGSPPEPVWDFRGQTVGVFRAISNHPTCAGCHPRDRTTLGFLSVRVSFPAIDSDVAQQWTTLIVAALASLVAAGTLIAMFFTLILGRRIDGLSHTMSRVEAGDLAARVPEDAPDELGRLGRSFNAMVARLAEARRRLEDRHAEEIRRAQSLASLGQLAAGIAHEINNPIAGMQNCVRTLGKGPKDEAQRIQYLDMLREGLDRIGRTVGHLLNFARESRPHLTHTDLPPLLQRCLVLLEHDLAARRVSCKLAVDGALPVLLADPHQLEQVFLNVLKNGLEAMPEGGRLTVSAGRRQREEGSFVEVRVADSGVGIPPENIPRIFDPFFTTKEVGKGTGLGLSVSYGIVRAHGGFIDVESDVGKGTTVTIALPLNGG
ncbi:MAG TPA: ATP-binding protein [Candidatus Methylomirabilis sp.]|nr:ATP-binding protein [Candidatus Methylomirabilis sp.]HSB81719.1 ATP-binding protein [Candidatus Methylomirabilis sp.]